MPLDRLLLICAVLAACGGYATLPPDTLLERKASETAVLARWEAQLGPLERCRAERERLRWENAPTAEASGRCVNRSPWAGCFAYDKTGAPVIALAEDEQRRPEDTIILRVHELTHWLLICSGVDDSGDPDHRREGVWRGLMGTPWLELL